MKKLGLLVMPLMAIPFLVGCGDKSITITWKDYDGTILEVDKNVERDSIPTYDGKELCFPCDGETLYYFDGWDPEVTKATKSQTYTAKYKIVDVKNVDAYFEVVIPDDAESSEMYISPTAMPDKEALIDWGDGSNSNGLSHEYEKPGKYEIKIRNITSLYFYEGSGYVTKAYFSKNIKDIDDETIIDRNSLASITIDERSELYDSRNNCNAIIDKNSDTLIVGCGHTIIPDSVVSIGEGAFFMLDALKSIVIPNSIISIDYTAFGHCRFLESVAFEDSPALETIVL